MRAHGLELRPESVREYAELVKGGCELHVDAYPTRMPAGACRLKALEHYGAGADGLRLWDTSARFARKSERRIVASRVAGEGAAGPTG